MSIWEYKHFEGEVRAQKCPEGVAIWKAEMDTYRELSAQPAATLTWTIPVLRFALAQKLVREWWT